jgi:hypothetical protein
VLVHNCDDPDLDEQSDQSRGSTGRTTPGGANERTTLSRTGIRSLQQQITEHQAKLGAYQADPDAYDNPGYLENAPSDEIRQQASLLRPPRWRACDTLATRSGSDDPDRGRAAIRALSALITRAEADR